MHLPMESRASPPGGDSRALVGAEVAPKTDGSLDDGLPLGFDALKN
jgi:hypothetical protein